MRHRHANGRSSWLDIESPAAPPRASSKAALTLGEPHLFPGANLRDPHEEGVLLDRSRGATVHHARVSPMRWTPLRQQLRSCHLLRERRGELAELALNSFRILRPRPKELFLPRRERLEA